jgi:predicted enzyme related to lactoylglutathione lyase
MPNPFVHLELNSTDVDKSKSFYGTLFDWTLEDTRIGDLDYTLIKVGKGTGGGIMQQLIPGASSAWLPYVVVDDIKASTAKARSLGAKVMKEVTEVPNMGWLSILVDPTGAMLGLWQGITDNVNRP